MTTPGYVGGELLKVYWLKKYNIPIKEGAACVVIAKTTMTIAEVLYMLAGISLAFWIVSADGSAGQTLTTALGSVGLLVCAVTGLIFLQRRLVCVNSVVDQEAGFADTSPRHTGNSSSFYRPDHSEFLQSPPESLFYSDWCVYAWVDGRSTGSLYNYLFSWWPHKFATDHLHRCPSSLH